MQAVEGSHAVAATIRKGPSWPNRRGIVQPRPPSLGRRGHIKRLLFGLAAVPVVRRNSGRRPDVVFVDLRLLGRSGSVSRRFARQVEWPHIGPGAGPFVRDLIRIVGFLICHDPGPSKCIGNAGPIGTQNSPDRSAPFQVCIKLYVRQGFEGYARWLGRRQRPPDPWSILRQHTVKPPSIRWKLSVTKGHGGSLPEEFIQNLYNYLRSTRHQNSLAVIIRFGSMLSRLSILSPRPRFRIF